MRPALRCDLHHTAVLDADLFAKTGTFFVEPIILHGESYTRIDVVGGPGTCADDGVDMSLNQIQISTV